MNIYILFADMVMILHAVLIVAVFIGIFISLKLKRFRPIEALVLVSAVVVWSLYGGCPLTNAEDTFRKFGDQPIPLKEFGFISYYLKTWFHLSLSEKMLEYLTYSLSTVFIGLTIDWELPFLRRILKK